MASSIPSISGTNDDADDLAATKLLKDQYQITEDYCNAATALHNALVAHQKEQNNSMLLFQTLQNYREALRRLQQCVRSLQKLVDTANEQGGGAVALNDNDHHHRPTSRTVLLLQHVERTQRILKAIHATCPGASFHANGLPVPRESSVQEGQGEELLALLATLRASIRSVEGTY